MNNLDQPAMPQPLNDLHPKGFSKREQAAITLRIPQSGDPELDAMILASRRLDIATAIAAGDWADGDMVINQGFDDLMLSTRIKLHLAYADALLKEAGL